MHGGDVGGELERAVRGGADPAELERVVEELEPPLEVRKRERRPGVDVGMRSGGEIVVGVAGDVLFASGQATLRTQAKSSLDQIAGVLKSQYANNQIRVEGHTDNDPIKKSGWKTNERLGAERAMAVEAYLVGKGIDNDRIYSATFGPSRPKGSKQDSRRVEIVLLGG